VKSPLIRHPEPDELESVFRLLFRHLIPEEQTMRIRSFLQSFQSGAITADGIFLAEKDGQILGTLYSQLRPDGSVLLFPPVISDSGLTAVSTAQLFAAFENYCRKHSVIAATALADDNQIFDEETFQTLGKFKFLSEMVCLASTAAAESIVSRSLEFVPMSEVAVLPFERMCGVVSKTYENTKDFPQLMTAMPIEGILRTYQGAAFLPELWFFIQQDGQDIGVLLVTDSRDGQMELTYMGLVPAVRRKGLSKEIVQFAQRLTFQRNGLFLTTSVDERNTAALKTYLTCGFKAWDRKRVFVRLFE
jgi:GNAT superfamily N-acetyltransferase